MTRHVQDDAPPAAGPDEAASGQQRQDGPSRGRGGRGGAGLVEHGLVPTPSSRRAP
ncbi:hypothetical protein [Actinomyces israelii]|uniref:hypothetical protein n=1 Tax=Actinomyces israelii TaxID=1659 RepID=UPI00399D5929